MSRERTESSKRTPHRTVEDAQCLDGSLVNARARSFTLHKVNLAEALAQIHAHWRPKVVGSLNGQMVKLAKFKGTFPWHSHESADELFLGLTGTFRVEFTDRTVDVGPGEFIVVPRGVEHRTVAEVEAEVLIFEPEATRNTGNVVDPTFTAPVDEGI